LTLALCRSTDRSTIGRAILLCRSTAWSTDMHQSAFVNFGRPGGRPTARALLPVGYSRPARSTDREFNSLVGNNGRPSDRPLSQIVRNTTIGGRPAGQPTKGFSSVIFSNGYILFCLFLGLFPTTLLCFLLMFSSPLNSGIMEKLNNKISKV